MKEQVLCPGYRPEVLPRIGVVFVTRGILYRIWRILPWVRRREREAKLLAFIEGLYQLTDCGFKVVEEEVNKKLKELRRQIAETAAQFQGEIDDMAEGDSDQITRLCKGLDILHKVVETFQERLILAGERFDRVEAFEPVLANHKEALTFLNERSFKAEKVAIEVAKALYEHKRARVSQNERIAKLEEQLSLIVPPRKLPEPGVN